MHPLLSREEINALLNETEKLPRIPPRQLVIDLDQQCIILHNFFYLQQCSFIERFNADKRRHIEGVAPDALERLYNYHWPGNVRELENVIERITILKGEGMITGPDLPDKLSRKFANGMVPNIDVPDEGLDFDTVVQSFEKQLLTKALEKTQGVKSKAAELLHMNRTTLVEKVKKLRLEA
jgi:transcriptional regulator with PAS, ATPase and Fis domain